MTIFCQHGEAGHEEKLLGTLLSGRVLSWLDIRKFIRLEVARIGVEKLVFHVRTRNLINRSRLFSDKQQDEDFLEEFLKYILLIYLAEVSFSPGSVIFFFLPIPAVRTTWVASSKLMSRGVILD
jgi:hypothetical protein